MRRRPLIIVFIIVLMLAAAMIFVLPRLLENVYVSNVYPGCSYRLAYVAFSDDDGDGIRDMGEAGVEGVAVQLSINGEVAREMQTDAEGVALFEAADVYICADGAATLMLVVDSQQFGPFLTTPYPQQAPLNTVYVAQTQ
ncbi:MAG: SdrD B-like domain-containing protein [Anaerolineae bacterium]